MVLGLVTKFCNHRGSLLCLPDLLGEATGTWYWTTGRGDVEGGGIGLWYEDTSEDAIRGSKGGTTDSDAHSSAGVVISRTGKIGSEEACMFLNGNYSSSNTTCLFTKKLWAWMSYRTYPFWVDEYPIKTARIALEENLSTNFGEAA